MSLASEPREGCLVVERLAAYADGTLDSSERAAIEAHLADCEDCRELVSETLRLSDDLTTAAGSEGTVARRGGRLGLWLAAAAAAAAVIATVFVLSRGTDRSELRALVAGVGAHRVTDGRLTGGFRWAEVALARGEKEWPALSPEAQIASARIEQLVREARTPENLAAFGTSRLFLGQIDAGVEALEEAVAVDQGRADFWSDLAVAYLARSSGEARAIDLPRALDACERSIALDPNLAEAWFTKAAVAERLNQASQARDSWNRYLKLDPSSQWADEARRRLQALGKPGSADGDAQSLRDQLFDAVLPAWAAAALEHDTAKATVNARTAQGLTLKLQQLSPDRSADEIVQCVIAARAGSAVERELAEGHRLFGEARTAYRADKFEVAFPLFRSAGRSLSQAGSPLVRGVRLHEALIAYRQQRPDDANSILVQLEKDLSGTAFQAVRGRAAWVRGLIAATSGRRSDAIALYTSAIAELDRSAELTNASFVRGLLATTYDAIGDPVRSWVARVAALRGSQREGTLLGAALSAGRMDLDRAAAFFQDSAIEVALAAGRPATLADALRIRATTGARLGQFPEVAASLARAELLISDKTGAAWDRLRAEIDLARAVLARDNIDASLEASSRALHYFSTAKSINRLPEIHLVRARLLRRSGAVDDAQRELQEGVTQLDIQRASMPTGQDLATFVDIQRRLADEIVDLKAEQNQTDAAFSVADGSRAPDVSRSSGSSTLTPAEIAERVPDGAVLIEYFVTDQRLFTWFIRHGSHTSTVTNVTRIELAALTRAAGFPRFDPSAASQLRARLLPASFGIRSGEIIVIVPDGPLHTLPFAALPGVRARYLVEENPTLLTPSLTMWINTSRQRSSSNSPRSIAAFGNPPIDGRVFPALRPLTGAEVEVRAVAASYPTRDVEIGAGITRAKFFHALESAEVVHFAGHAVMNSSSPSESILIIHDGEAAGITAGEIRDIRARSKLVVLASCQAAGGYQTRSDGPLGLARAFLVAGVSVVVASQWLVDDAIAAKFYDVFHQVFVGHGDAALALQAAQRVLVNGTEAQRDPKHWAGVVAIAGASGSTSPDGRF